MTEPELHPYVEWIAREARRSVVTDRASRERVMAAVRAEPAPRRSMPIVRAWSRLVEPRTFALSPASSTLLAAGLVGIGVLAGVLSSNRGAQLGGGSETRVAQQLPVSPSVDTVQKFVFVGPAASNVSLVGDFNGWDTNKTPMVRAGQSGLWTVTLPLTAGRHVYAFVVDGSTWDTDPGAPLAPDDGFGHANSVRIVRGPTL
jgi:hypothetical protein